MQIQEFLRLLNWFWAILDVLTDQDGNYGPMNDKNMEKLAAEAEFLEKKIEGIFHANNVEYVETGVRNWNSRKFVEPLLKITDIGVIYNMPKYNCWNCSEMRLAHPDGTELGLNEPYRMQNVKFKCRKLGKLLKEKTMEYSCSLNPKRKKNVGGNL